jgi:hypothetical protein
MSQTGAQAAPSAAAGVQVTTAALEDTLYEMLAVGLDPCESRVTQKEIQQFLFEHARSPKSKEEFLRFFQAHNLPTDLESEPQPVAPNPVPDLAGHAPPRAAAAPRAPRLQAGDRLGASGVGMELSGFLPEPRPPFEPELPLPETRPRTALYLLCGVGAAILLLFGAIAGIGYTNIVSLKQELEQTRAAQARDRRAVERVDEQITVLGSRTTNTGDVLADMEYKLDRVVEVVAPGPESAVEVEREP